MNDYEINLRLAEIAGVDPLAMCDKIDDGKRPAGYGTQWSPLTDWSQLGPLIERFDVATKRIRGATPRHDGKWSAITGPDNDCNIVVDSDLKRAVCLAIIEAHEGETNA